MLSCVKSYVHSALSPRTFSLDMSQDYELPQNFIWGSSCSFSMQWYFSQSQFWSLINWILFASVFYFYDFFNGIDLSSGEKSVSERKLGLHCTSSLFCLSKIRWSEKVIFRDQFPHSHCVSLSPGSSSEVRIFHHCLTKVPKAIDFETSFKT